MWFELSRVKLWRNDLKGNENYFELEGGSSYRESTVCLYFYVLTTILNFSYKVFNMRHMQNSIEIYALSFGRLWSLREYATQGNVWNSGYNNTLILSVCLVMQIKLVVFVVDSFHICATIICLLLSLFSLRLGALLCWSCKEKWQDLSHSDLIQTKKLKFSSEVPTTKIKQNL